MPKIVDRAAMKARIIEAAMTAFQRHGYVSAKMTDIAEEAGLAKGTLYLYFKRKEDLTRALVDAFFAHWEAALSEMPAPEKVEDFAAQLRYSSLPDGQSQREVRMFFEILGSSTGSEDLLIAVAQFQDRLGRFYAEKLDALAEKGKLRAGLDTAATGRALAAMFDGLVLHRSLFLTDSARYVVIVDQAIGAILSGILAEAV
ncbi:TetR/AcrR family transcriptional regulator [Shimia sp. SDUM112013]|uniref:TetR/AcrR family transcriptional regulator n=1 Tax=Shimia sp. SDUM112013 TaxID=3136160 RepID=UPI0032EED0D6